MEISPFSKAAASDEFVCPDPDAPNTFETEASFEVWVAHDCAKDGIDDDCTKADMDDDVIEDEDVEMSDGTK